MRSPGWCVCGAFAALLLVPVPASAREKAARAPAAHGDQFVEFSDDLLDADLPLPFGDPLLAGHLRPPRAQLIRPRTNFIPELYQSVEQL